MVTLRQYPDTVACYVGVRRTDTGAIYTPSTSMTVSIWDPAGVLITNAANMTNITTVVINTVSYNYVYYYATTGSSNMGTYRIRYTATNGSYVTIQDDSFVLSRTGV